MSLLHEAIQRGQLADVAVRQARESLLSPAMLAATSAGRSETKQSQGPNVIAGRKQIDTWQKTAGCFYHPCFVMRLGGVSGGKATQGWRDSSHTAMVGAGKFGSAKLPMATATYPRKPSLSQ
jgi:hypothetical protein